MHEPDYYAADVSEKTLQSFEVLWKHIYIHNRNICISLQKHVLIILLVLVVVSATFNKALVLKNLKCFE